MLVNAVADVFLNEITSQFNQEPSVDSEVTRRLGEEIIINKLHNIFDEISQEKELFDRKS